MSSKKILVLISGSGSNLQAIIDQVHLSDEPGNIVAVISNKADAYGLERAANAGIETSVVASKGITDRAQYDQALISEIDNYQPDLIVMAGFMRILTPEFVQHYSGKMLNIHPSLLPKYQGLNTHQRAIDANDEEHGASVHFVTEELDGGPVILQAKVPVFSDDQAEDLAARVQDQEHRIYPLAVKWFVNNRLCMQGGKAVLDDVELPEQGYAND
ncbi:phosphoribosylglycinamide formyltransferase [Motilimonas cestriensis]|uniref:Phosphoribosylglycinamide formyltransferase n=1 Tax=Motilimonas cestriensis TaxID=2742685 RepID=A0ABS8W4L3_9GAMM|nr:phosphoribosylglycinamide formyltransferase [Motilimonas cestriensis]MCE2593425.1 phosphoribosylglycinamide formyltransferase [Motilimonas cestriensis]